MLDSLIESLLTNYPGIILLMIGLYGLPLIATTQLHEPRYLSILAEYSVLGIIYWLIIRRKPQYQRMVWWGLLGLWILVITTLIWPQTGFPIPARVLPECGACWSNYPPFSALGTTIANVIICQIIWLFIAQLFERKISKKWIIIAWLLAIYGFLCWVGVLLVLFD